MSEAVKFCIFILNKQLRVISFGKKEQLDVVLDSESNGYNFSALVVPGGEKKIIFIFVQDDVTSWRGRFFRFFAKMKVLKKN